MKFVAFYPHPLERPPSPTFDINSLVKSFEKIANNQEELSSLSNIAQDVIKANAELEKYKQVHSKIAISTNNLLTTYSFSK